MIKFFWQKLLPDRNSLKKYRIVELVGIACEIKKVD